MSNDERLHIYGFMHCEIASRDIECLRRRGRLCRHRSCVAMGVTRPFWN